VALASCFGPDHDHRRIDPVARPEHALELGQLSLVGDQPRAAATTSLSKLDATTNQVALAISMRTSNTRLDSMRRTRFKNASAHEPSSPCRTILHSD
jgi:hypothetical protein